MTSMEQQRPPPQEQAHQQMIHNGSLSPPSRISTSISPTQSPPENCGNSIYSEDSAYCFQNQGAGLLFNPFDSLLPFLASGSNTNRKQGGVITPDYLFPRRQASADMYGREPMMMMNYSTDGSQHQYQCPENDGIATSSNCDDLTGISEMAYEVALRESLHLALCRKKEQEETASEENLVKSVMFKSLMEEETINKMEEDIIKSAVAQSLIEEENEKKTEECLLHKVMMTSLIEEDRPTALEEDLLRNVMEKSLREQRQTNKADEAVIKEAIKRSLSERSSVSEEELLENAIAHSLTEEQQFRAEEEEMLKRVLESSLMEQENPSSWDDEMLRQAMVQSLAGDSRTSQAKIQGSIERVQSAVYMVQPMSGKSSNEDKKKSLSVEFAGKFLASVSSDEGKKMSSSLQRVIHVPGNISAFENAKSRGEGEDTSVSSREENLRARSSK